MTHKLPRVAAAVAAGALAAPFAHADLVLNEQFLTGADPSAGQYTTDPLVRLNQQAPVVQGFATSGWISGAGTGQTHVVDGSLDAPGASYEAGGKVQFDGSPVDNLYRSNARSLVVPYASASANGPIYLSGMISTDAFPDNPGNTGLRGYSLFGLTNLVGANATTDVTLAGYFLGFRANADDSVDLVLRHRDGTNSSLADMVLYSGASTATTYQFLVKTDVNVVNGNQETIHWWINPADVTSEETATSTALASGTFNDYSFQNADREITRVTVAQYNWDTNTYLDEFRLGTTFADVAGSAVVTPTHNPGDTNSDGVVDLADLNNVLNNFGSAGTLGDDNGSGAVELGDLNNVLNNFGTHYTASSALSAVPEPASLSLLALGASSLLIRRRRQA